MYKGVIYRLTNKHNKNMYIGQTRDLRKRIWQHKAAANNVGTRNEGQPIVKAIREYGIDAFDVDVLYESEEFENPKDLKKHMDEMEIYYIEKYDTVNHGYNITKGGGGHLGYRMSDEVLKKMSDAKKGKKIFSEDQKKAISERVRKMWENQEYKQRMSERFKGEKNPMYGVRLTRELNHNYGKHLSEETKRKLSESNKGRKGTPMSDAHKEKLSKLLKGVPKSPEHRRKLSEANLGKESPKKWKPILQYTLDGDFVRAWKNISEAQIFYNNNHITDCVNGKRNNVAGFYWMFKGDKIEPKVEVPQRAGNRRIAQIDKEGNIIREFKTIREASRVLELRYSGISNVLQGLQKKTGDGYMFKYIS